MAASSLLSYAVLLAILFTPMFVFVHPYLHMLIIASTNVYIGCQRSLTQAKVAKANPEQSQVETVSSKDAMQFPLIGSCVLFSLYVVVKYVNKEYLAILLAVYFFGLGVFGVFSTIRAPLKDCGLDKDLPVFKKKFKLEFWDKEKEAEEFEFTYMDVVLLLFSGCIAFGYVYKKHWVLNNILGCAFSIQGIELLVLGSYQIGCMLLSGLFLYDIFWVFGTEVMVTVAKNFDAPVKLMFPKALVAEKMQFSMLGLGDIVIPGIFVAMMLRYDDKMGLALKPYFRTNFVFYILGLVATVAVMHFFEAAQPALLYLVPACMGSSALTGVVRGEFKSLWEFSEEKDAEEAKKKKEEAEHKKTDGDAKEEPQAEKAEEKAAAPAKSPKKSPKDKKKPKKAD